jgi:hypothetical protein
MSAGPQDASLNGDGFRFYRWEAPGEEPVDVLSVTSIRTLCGESFQLVNWQLANLADAALGTMKRTVIGPRGGVKDVRQVWQYPSEFVAKYDETQGQQAKVDDLRKWLREQADSPRNIAAVRGTIVHEAIEKNVQWDRVERAYVESALAGLSKRDRDKMKNGISDEDVFFVRNALRQYWAMRREVPFVIIAREPQVFNLTAGYAGSADALVWFLPEGVSEDDIWAPRSITLDHISKIGGEIALIDWKTSADVHTDHVVQAHAYMGAEFVGSNGVIDQRLTDILVASQTGGLVHIRPNTWGIHLFDFQQEVMRGFLGACAFARLLAKYPKPQALFTREYSGQSAEEDE